MALIAQSRAAAQPKPATALTVERCAGLPFDVEAYERVLIVELRVLEAQAAGAGDRQLRVRSPGCNDELEVRVQIGERSAAELLHASDYTGVGQPRALALATIETLRVLTTRLQSPATPVPGAPVVPAPAPGSDSSGGASAPTPASEQPPAADQPPASAVEAADPAAPPDPGAPSEPAAPSHAAPEPTPAPAPPVAPAPPSEPAPQPEPDEPDAPEPPDSTVSFEVYAGIGGGLFDALDWQTELGAAYALTPSWWVDAELAFGGASDSTALGSVDASAFTLALSLELRPRLKGPFELSFGVGLRGGAIWASADSSLPRQTGAQLQDAVAPALLAFAEIGVALEVAKDLRVGLFVEPGLGIESAELVGPSASSVEADDAASASQPQLDLLGPGVHGGLTLGYRF